MRPWSASQPPSASTATCPNAGIVCIAGWRRAWMFTRRTRDANISRERSVSRSSSRALLTEALHDAHAGDVFLDDVRDVARLLLRVPARGEHRRAQLHRGDEQQRRDREHHERQQRREPEHRAERHDEQEDVRDADRQELQESLQERDVGRRPAHELTGLRARRGSRSRGAGAGGRSRCAGRAARRARCGRRGNGGSTRTRT